MNPVDPVKPRTIRSEHWTTAPRETPRPVPLDLPEPGPLFLYVQGKGLSLHSPDGERKLPGNTMAILQGPQAALVATLQDSTTLVALWPGNDADLGPELTSLGPVHILPMLGSMGESVRSLAFHLPFGGLAGALYRQSRHLELLAYSLHCLGCPLRREARKMSHDSLLVQKARQLQETDLAQPPSIVELCRSLGTNESRINAAFQRVLGCTPYEHVKAQRLQKAKALLRETDLSIGEVARRVGYTSQAHFSVLFHKAAGLPPREFRRQHIEA